MLSYENRLLLFGFLISTFAATESLASNCITLGETEAKACLGDRVYLKKYFNLTWGYISAFDFNKNKIIVNVDGFGEHDFSINEIAFQSLNSDGVKFGQIIKVKYLGMIRDAHVKGVYLNGDVMVGLEGYSYKVFSRKNIIAQE